MSEESQTGNLSRIKDQFLIVFIKNQICNSLSQSCVIQSVFKIKVLFIFMYIFFKIKVLL